MDIDIDGAISPDEFAMYLLPRAGFTYARVLELWRELDVDGDGKITREEFISTVTSTTAFTASAQHDRLWQRRHFGGRQQYRQIPRRGDRTQRPRHLCPSRCQLHWDLQRVERSLCVRRQFG